MDVSIYSIVLVVLAGLSFGSFITLASYRLPRDISVVRPPSACPSCQHRLGLRDLVPVLSWLLSAGKCRHCSALVHWRYPVIELITAFVFLWIVMVHGYAMPSAVLALFAVALLVMIVADFETGLLPDEAQIAAAALGVLYAIMVPYSFVDVLVTVALLGGTGLLLHYGYFWLMKKHGLGFGDVKLLFVCGVWLGDVYLAVPFLLVGGLLGVMTALVWRGFGKGAVFPFGPALAITLFVLVMHPDLGWWLWSLAGL